MHHSITTVSRWQTDCTQSHSACRLCANTLLKCLQWHNHLIIVRFLLYKREQKIYVQNPNREVVLIKYVHPQGCKGARSFLQFLGLESRRQLMEESWIYQKELKLQLVGYTEYWSQSLGDFSAKAVERLATLVTLVTIAAA